MEIDFKKANLMARSIITSTLPGGKMEGHDYVVKSPLRYDKNPGSFRINMKDGYYRDFATNEGGDILELFAKINGLTMAEAASKLMSNDRIPITINQIKIEERDELVTPVPDSVHFPTCFHMEYGAPNAIYQYRGENDDLLMIVARYSHDGKKQIRPYTYRRTDTGCSWKVKAFGDNSPLYGLNRLLQSPKKPVVVVEGEKCVDVLQAMLDGFVVVSWQGGSNSVNKTDWTPLHGKQVYLWADNDEAGKKAMSDIKIIISGKAKTFDVKIPDDRPAKWDAADAVLIDNMRKDEIIALIAPPIITFSKPYRSLGHDHGNYFFYPKGSSQVLAIHGGALSRKTLLMIAPLDHWEMEYPGQKGIQWDLAVNNLMRECEARGVFSSARIRGRGVWMDAGKTVVHLGGTLLCDHRQYGLDDLQTRFIYETRPATSEPSADYLSAEEAGRFLKICELLRWENKSTGALFAGWAFLAPICGILDWRPHAWVTGAAGAGKSWVLNKLLNPMLGENVVYALGGSTSVGIVQELGSDALPVVIEEAEGDNIKQKQYIEDMLTIARQSSSETGASIFKGTISGKSINYSLKSMFMFNSISVGLRHHADESRVTVMSLSEDIRADRVAKFEELSRVTYETITKDYCNRMRSRAIKLIPIIKQNVAVFASVASTILGSQRLGDQLGTLLAGAYAIQSDDLVDKFTAESFALEMKLSEVTTVKERKDEETCLSVILQSVHKMQDRYAKTIDCSLGEVLSVICEGKLDSPFGYEECNKQLLMLGIKNVGDTVVFSCNSEAIKRILSGTPWSNNYSRMLKRIPHAETTNPMRFGPGVKDRGISIPIAFIFKGEDE
jgi:putative DNA primase/helicase